MTVNELIDALMRLRESGHGDLQVCHEDYELGYQCVDGVALKLPHYSGDVVKHVVIESVNANLERWHDPEHDRKLARAMAMALLEQEKARLERERQHLLRAPQLDIRRDMHIYQLFAIDSLMNAGHGLVQCATWQTKCQFIEMERVTSHG